MAIKALPVVLLFVVINIFKTVTALQELKYTCDNTGIASIEDTDLKRLHILLNETLHEYCNPSDKNLNNCRTNFPLSNPLKVLYEEEINPKILGGHIPEYFSLECGDNIVNKTAQTSFKQTYAGYTQNYTPRTQNVNKELTLNIFDKDHSTLKKDVHIGEEILLVMNCTSNYIVSPQQCKAKPSSGTESDEVPLWTNTDSCDGHDSALINSTWNGGDSSVSIAIYGFKFVDSEEVTITCRALICPKSKRQNCQRNCVNKDIIRRRRRNAILDSLTKDETASISFRVVSPDNRANDGVTSHSVLTFYAFFLYLVVH